MACDNTAGTNLPTVTDVQYGLVSQTFTVVASHDAANTSAGGSTRGFIIIVPSVNTTGASNTFLSVSFSASPSKSVGTGAVFTGASSTVRSSTATNTTTPATLATGAGVQAGDLALGLASCETNVAMGLTGGWSLPTTSSVFTTGGGAAANVSMKVGYAIPGSSGTVTGSISGNANDGGACAVALQPGSGLQTISPSGIGSAGAFGTTTVNLQLQIVTPSGIASGEAFGTAKLNLNVTATGIASGEAVGTAKVNLTVFPSGVSSAEAFGTTTVSPGPVTVSPSGVTSGEAFGTAVVSIAGGPQTVSPTGIASGQAFGTTVVTPGAVTLSPTGIPSGGAFGTTNVIGSQVVSPAGIVSAGALGNPVVSSSQLIQALGIGSAQAVGTPTVRRVVYIASPPTVARYPAAERDMFGRNNPLHQRVSIPVGITVYLRDGVYHQGRNLPDDLVADVVYRGGSEYVITADLVPELEAEGFTIRTETR